MSILESLPYDILLAIGNKCTRPELNGIARTNSLCYSVFNRMLYDRNIHHEPPHESCIFFAIQTDNIATIKKALEHGADVNIRALEPPIPFLLGGQDDSDDSDEDEDGDDEEDEDEEDENSEPEGGNADNGGDVVVNVMDMVGLEGEALVVTISDDAKKMSYNPLQCATYFRRHEIVKYLLQQGADLESTAQGGCDCLHNVDHVSALHIALSHGQGEGNATAIAKTLIESGARESGHGHPAIFEIVEGAEVELFDALADLPGVDIHATDRLGRNLLHLAVDSYDGACLPLCQRLIERGVAINQVDNMGRTPFSSMATCGEYIRASTLLLDHGANLAPETDNNDGFYSSNMMRACIFDIMDYPSGIPWESHSEFVKDQTERTQLVKILLAKDNTPDAGHSHSRRQKALANSLFGAAAHLKDVHCMQILLDAGAKVDSFVGRNFFWGRYPFMVAFVKHEVEKWKFLTLECIPEEISIVARVRLLLENGAPLGPVGQTAENDTRASTSGPLNNNTEIENEEPAQAEGGEGDGIDVVEQDELEVGERQEQDDEEWQWEWESDSSDSTGSNSLFGIEEMTHISAMAMALRLATSDKKASLRPEVGFKLNDVFLDIFCEYATKDNIAKQYIDSLIQKYTQPRLAETELGNESPGRLTIACGKLAQLRQRLYP